MSLNFILNNYIFEIIISILFIINFIFIVILDSKEAVLEYKNDYKSNAKLEIFKIHYPIIVLVIIALIVIHHFRQYYKIFASIVIPIVCLIISLFIILKERIENKSLAIMDKYIFTFATIVFIILFSSNTTQIYYNLFVSLPHIWKELLLITYLLFKIILFVFLILNNISVLISNAFIIFSNIKEKIKKNKNEPKYFNFLFWKYIKRDKFKNKFNFFTYILGYIIFSPFIFLLNIICIVLLKFLKRVKIFLYNTFDAIIKFDNNRNKIIKKITNWSIIIALSINYVNIVLNKQLFSEEIIEIYTFFSTTILIPLIYDSVKTKK